MRIAVVDIGSNSIRLLIARKQSGAIKVLRTELISSRLGEGIGSQVFLNQKAIDRTLEGLLFFQKVIHETGVEEVIAVATSAVRDASNRLDFLAQVKDLLGWNVRILTGSEEAQFSYLGVVKGLNTASRCPAVIDIGGGSTEFTWSAGGKLRFLSTRAGAVRMTETAADRTLIVGVLQDVLDAMNKDGFDQLVGVGGTVTTLAAIDRRLKFYDPAKVHGLFIGTQKVQEILACLEGMPIDKRKKVSGLQAQRADIIVAGIKILLTILEGLGAPGITVSETDIMYGLACEDDSSL